MISSGIMDKHIDARPSDLHYFEVFKNLLMHVYR